MHVSSFALVRDVSLFRGITDMHNLKLCSVRFGEATGDLAMKSCEF